MNIAIRPAPGIAEIPDRDNRVTVDGQAARDTRSAGAVTNVAIAQDHIVKRCASARTKSYHNGECRRLLSEIFQRVLFPNIATEYISFKFGLA